MSPETLTIGQVVTIRRTDGRSQVAQVIWVMDKHSMFFMPPECLVFEVAFTENGKHKRKCCRAQDLLGDTA